MLLLIDINMHEYFFKTKSSHEDNVKAVRTLPLEEMPCYIIRSPYLINRFNFTSYENTALQTGVLKYG